MPLTEAQYATLQKLNTKLNSLTTLKGRFTQVNPDGSKTGGIFFLQRPGKIRFEYTPPNPNLIISDGKWIGIENREENRTEKYPLSRTPFHILLDEYVDLKKSTLIIDLQENDDQISIFLELKGEERLGRLILVFRKPDLTLSEWRVIDTQDFVTHVRLFDTVSGIFLEENLFWIEEHLDVDHSNER
ncbi:MAG: outer membrane lipoprotein carrier protein LolA [Alphaproteobacteria bacterium]|nr:outer membrane lipoprotein carrier protein LolA [Alphaproteobacteria bacterium]